MHVTECVRVCPIVRQFETFATCTAALCTSGFEPSSSSTCRPVVAVISRIPAVCPTQSCCYTQGHDRTGDKQEGGKKTK